MSKSLMYVYVCMKSYIHKNIYRRNEKAYVAIVDPLPCLIHTETN